MKLAKLCLVLVSVFSTTAMAIPAFDGTYLCSTPEGQSATITMTTQDESLILSGLESQALGTGQPLPCSNEEENMAQEGISMRTVTKCTEDFMSLFIDMMIPAQEVDLQVDLSLSLMDPNTVGMSVTVKTKVGSESMDEKVVLTCTK